MQRDWAAAQASKRAHWAEIYRRDGWRVVWDAAQHLLVYMRSSQPNFPGERSRAEDLRNHQALKNRIDGVAHAFTRR